MLRRFGSSRYPVTRPNHPLDTGSHDVFWSGIKRSGFRWTTKATSWSPRQRYDRRGKDMVAEPKITPQNPRRRQRRIVNLSSQPARSPPPLPILGASFRMPFETCLICSFKRQPEPTARHCPHRLGDGGYSGGPAAVRARIRGKFS